MSCRRPGESARADSEKKDLPSRGPNEVNRGVMVVSTNFYRIGKSKDRDLDLRELNGSARELNGDARGAMRYRADHSTSRGAVYPALVITEYFTGLPFSLILSASPVWGSTSSTLILRNLPSLA